MRARASLALLLMPPLRCSASVAASLLAACLLAACNAPPLSPLPALSGPVFTVYAAGDIASCPHGDTRFSGAADTAEVLAPELARTPRAALLLLGDNVYPHGTA